MFDVIVTGKMVTSKIIFIFGNRGKPEGTKSANKVDGEQLHSHSHKLLPWQPLRCELGHCVMKEDPLWGVVTPATMPPFSRQSIRKTHREAPNADAMALPADGMTLAFSGFGDVYFQAGTDRPIFCP